MATQIESPTEMVVSFESHPDRYVHWNLKIDGSLMQSIAKNQALQEQVRQYVKAAKARKISTIAERVEDANTMAVLFQLGLNYIQGHYVHEPEVVLEEAPADPALSPLPTGSDS